MQGDVDSVFLGVDMRVSPHLLPNGVLSYAENNRLRNGSCDTRKGTWVPPWANKVDGDGKVTTMGEAHGGTVFKDPTTNFPWIIIAAGGKFYAGHHSRAVFEIDAPPDLVLSGRVRFIQCFDGLLALREGGATPLILKSINGGFMYVDQGELEVDENEVPIEQHLPSSAFGVHFQNRVFVPHSNDLVFASLVNECTKGAVTLQSFRVNQGSDDVITAIYKYGESSLLIGKERSVYIVRNVYGDLSNIILDEFSSEYGIAGPDCCVSVGSDLWFLAPNRGIVSVRQTELNEIQGNTEPISKAITPIIEKIDWNRAYYSLAATFDSYVYFIVPIMACGVETWTMLVYDTQVNAWVSADWGPWLENPISFMPLVYNGKQRLGILNSNGYVVLLDDGRHDEYFDGSLHVKQPVHHVVRTRGYLGVPPGVKDYKLVSWLVDSWDPHYDVWQKAGGASEMCCVRKGITKDKTVFQKPWNAKAYRLDNKDDNHYAPYKEDYSLSFANGVKMCFGRNGIKPELFQEFNESGSINKVAPFLQIEFRSHRGSLKIKQVAIGANEATMGLQSKV